MAQNPEGGYRCDGGCGHRAASAEPFRSNALVYGPDSVLILGDLCASCAQRAAGVLEAEFPAGTFVRKNFNVGPAESMASYRCPNRSCGQCEGCASDLDNARERQAEVGS